MDSWQSMTLGDVFPGLTQSFEKIQAQANDLFKKYSAVANQLNDKVSALNAIINTTGNFLNTLQSTGLYVCYLSPASGGWATRLQNATGAPPNSGYSAGVCLIAQGPDLNSVAKKYQELMKILTSPIQVP